MHLGINLHFICGVQRASQVTRSLNAVQFCWTTTDELASVVVVVEYRESVFRSRDPIGWIILCNFMIIYHRLAC